MKKISTINKLVIFCVTVFALFISLFCYEFSHNDGHKVDNIYGVDYTDYYATGKMVIEGDIANIYNDQVHQIKFESILGRELPFLMAWPYPPTFLLAIVPLAFLPHYISMAVWMILTFTLCFFSIYKLVPKCKKLAFLLLGFPAVLMNLKWAQNAFLSTALLSFGLLFVESSPILSGLAFGLLTYKPQLAVIPFLLLLLLKKWRVFLWSCVFALTLTLVSGLVFGVDTWINFVQQFFANTVGNYLEWESRAAINTTLYSFFRLIGINNSISYILLGITVVASFIVVYWVWHKTDNERLRGAIFVMILPLCSSYFLQYDLVILAIPLVLLAYDFYLNGYHDIEFLALEILSITTIICWPLVLLTRIQILPITLIGTIAMVMLRCNQKQIKPL